VTGLSDGTGGRRRRGFWRALRDAVRRLQTLDLDAIENRITAAEKAFREIDNIQRAVAKEIHWGLAKATLISPLELTTEDRFILESRCRALTNPVYLGNDTALCRMLGFCKIYLNTTDTGFGCHLLLDGFWEMWVTIFLARQIKPGMTVIDVGANYGYYTLLFGALVGPTGRVYAVEPNPAVIPKLRRSIDLNGLASRVTLVEAAAGAVEGGEANLFAPHGEPKNATIVTMQETADSPLGVFYRVPRTTADNFAAAATRIDFVKIDAEGAEEAVIAGMMNILTRDKPGLILEFNAARYHNPSSFVEKLTAVYSRMRYIDYQCNASPVTVDDLLSKNWGEDWLLYLDDPTAPIPT
jgi:FkbM family methyltransferase